MEETKKKLKKEDVLYEILNNVSVGSAKTPKTETPSIKTPQQQATTIKKEQTQQTNLPKQTDLVGKNKVLQNVEPIKKEEHTYQYAEASDYGKKSKKKSEDKGFKNSYIYGFIFIIFSLILEATNFIRLGLGVFPINFAIELCIILIIAGIIFIVPTEPLKIIVLSLFFGTQLVMNVANASLYKMMYELVTVDMIFTLGFETTKAFEFNQIDIISFICAVIILILFILAIVFGNKYMPKFKMRKKKSAIAALLILLLSIEMIGIAGLKVSKEAYFEAKAEYLMDDNRFMYETLSAKYASLKKFGFWSFYINNAKIFFNYKKSVSAKELETLNNFVNEGDNKKYLNSTHLGNSVSGLLSGDNLIVIMMESIEWFAIDPINTPNLYEFINEDALKFENFAAKNKTNISEDIPILGSIVNDYSFSTINDKVGIKVPNSLPNLFKNAGYQSVNYFHDYYGNFYDRNDLNTAFGFNNVYSMDDCTELEKSKYFGDFIDDGEFIGEMRNKFMPADQKFFSFFTTVTTHGPYEKSNDRYAQNYDYFENNYNQYCAWVNGNKAKLQEMGLLNLTPKKGTHEYAILKEYKSKAMALENMFNVIDIYLTTTTDQVRGGVLKDNTTIVLYADHNAYYSDLSYFVKQKDKYASDKSLYTIPFVIYNKDLQPAKIDTFCNTYDIYPTICDLYGLSFNRNLTQGFSVFSDDIKNSIFVSTICGVFDNDFYSVTFDDYTAQDTSINTNSKLDGFKKKVDNFLRKQDLIETYYRINYEEYIKIH